MKTSQDWLAGFLDSNLPQETKHLLHFISSFFDRNGAVIWDEKISVTKLTGLSQDVAALHLMNALRAGWLEEIIHPDPFMVIYKHAFPSDHIVPPEKPLLYLVKSKGNE